MTAEERGRLAGLPERLRALEARLATRVIGQSDTVRQLLIAFFAKGHVLVTGVPGLAKTLMIRTLAELFDLDFSRIQFTPDLMPSDITGTTIIVQDETTGRRDFRFRGGPIFTNLLLADEINRTPPKTQSALLEAMEEYQVTIGGQPHPMPRPFFVLATQNPIEQEGTYPLPVTQLDRFIFQIDIGYPDAETEFEVIASTT
ncbi:MAG: AAA family ATPase, partial [Planctomycetes bacterium]|nr:AAA family ATPase [Planctomycetota bacterium]